MKIYLTRDSLKKGIREAEGEITNGRMRVLSGNAYNDNVFGWPISKRDYTNTLEEALDRVSKLRTRKIAEMEAELARLKVEPVKITLMDD